MQIKFVNKVNDYDVLAKDIVDINGTILLKAGVKLSNNYIRQLKKMGIFNIYVENESLEDIQIPNSELIKIFQTINSFTNELIKNIHNINNFNLKESFERTNKIIKSVLNVKELNYILYSLKEYNNYVYTHNLSTCSMSVFMGLSYGLTNEELIYLCIGSILHDIGKLKISNNILNKTIPFTNREIKELKKHPIYGKEIIQKQLYFPEIITTIVEQHHERIDGKGYPYGLKGNSISIYAKIISICSTYNFINNNSYYKNKFNSNDIYELILSGANTIFDHKLVNCFKNTFSIYPLGAEVQLSNKDKGFVIKQNQGFPDRPIVRIFNDNLKFYYEVDLLKNTNITIISINK